MMTFKQRKEERTKAYNARYGVKTGDLREIAEVKYFYATQSDGAQAREEQRACDQAISNVVGELYKYYFDEGLDA